MFLIKCVFILNFILCLFFGFVQCLVTLPKVEDNNIINAESVIRTTVNSLFSSLGIKKVRDKPRLKQYSIAHNYFVSLTLQDFNSLKEIAKLTRVVKSNSSDVNPDYITLINEILDEDNVHKLQSIILGENITPEYDIESEKVKLESLNKYHADLKDKYPDINEEVLKILQQEGSLELNGTTNEVKNIEDSNENVLHDLPIWHEDEALSNGRRLFDAKQTKIKKYPFMASVQIFNKFQCGGSIIKADLVITAASCLQLAWNNRFYRENPAFLSVRVGTSFYEVGGEKIAVMEVYFHPSYNPKNLHNNIAVMRLVRMIRFKKKKGKVKKILLDDKDSSLPLNVLGVEILGWGARTRSNRLNGPWEDKLRQATLGVYPLNDCQDVYSKEYVTSQNFCAGTVSVGSGACNRDVGGPGIISGKLAGIISFGAPVCGTPDAPTVFTKVGLYYDWIEEIMEQDVPHIRQKTTSLPLTFPYASANFYSSPHQWTLLPVKTTSNSNIANSGTISTDSLSLKEMDDKLFKEFLRTIFKSAEIEEYFDTLNPTAEPATQPTIRLEVIQQQSTTKQPDVQQLITDQTTKQYLNDISNKDSMISNTKKAIVFPSVDDSESSSDSEERFPSSSMVMTSYQLELDGTKPTSVPDLVMEYSSDSTNESEHEESYLHLRDQVKRNKVHESSKETFNTPSLTNKTDNAVNNKIDDALLALLYVSDSENVRKKDQLDKAKMLNNEQRKNNKETFVEPVAPGPFKDLTYRIQNEDNIENIRKLFNDDVIIDFLKHQVMSYISDPLLKLNESALEPLVATVAESTSAVTLETKLNSTLPASTVQSNLIS